MNAPNLTPQQWEEIGPELYAALERVTQQLAHEEDEAWTEARVALAKARGETP